MAMAARSAGQAAISVAALLCTFALLSNFAHADCGGFALSCSSISIDQSGVLRASCKKENGGSESTDLALDQFISNSNGNLVDGAGFSASCSNINFYKEGTDNQGVQAVCKRDDGTTDTTQYNLEARVSNNNGILVFNSCRRRSLLEASAIAGRKMLNV